MRILGARIFSKTFGGKIRAFWTANTYKLKKKLRRMRIFSARIFLSFLAGKLKLIPRTRYTKFLQIFIFGLEVSHRE